MNRIVNAAIGSKNYDAFRADMEKCNIAVTTCGLYQIKAETWLDILQNMTDIAIYEYVENKYFPGALNPFDDRT